VDDEDTETQEGSTFIPAGEEGYEIDFSVDKGLRSVSQMADEDKIVKGRPSCTYTLAQVYALAAMMCTDPEIAAGLGMSYSSWQLAKKRDPDIKTVLTIAKENGKMSLRRAQFKNAIEHNNANMQKWLGIQYLDQSDKVEANLNVADMRPNINLTMKQPTDITVPQIAYTIINDDEETLDDNGDAQVVR